MTTKNAQLFSIILAAGSSRRFGSAKQLAAVDGQSLVRRAAALAAELTGRNTLIVVGAAWQPVLNEILPFDGFIVRNERHADGIGSSIACGVRAVSGIADAVLVLLADQPRITVAHLRALAASREQDPRFIVASRYAGVSGVPAIFPASFFPELGSLQHDRGARSVIANHPSEVLTVDFDDAAIDIDTPGDLAAIH